MQNLIALIIDITDTFRSLHPDFKCLLSRYLKLDHETDLESTYGLAEMINAIMNVTPDDCATIKTLRVLTSTDDYKMQIFYMIALSPEELKKLQELLAFVNPSYEPHVSPWDSKMSSCEELYENMQSIPKHAITAITNIDMLFTFVNARRNAVSENQEDSEG